MLRDRKRFENAYTCDTEMFMFYFSIPAIIAPKRSLFQSFESFWLIGCYGFLSSHQQLRSYGDGTSV